VCSDRPSFAINVAVALVVHPDGKGRKEGRKEEVDDLQLFCATSKVQCSVLKYKQCITTILCFYDAGQFVARFPNWTISKTLNLQFGA
jgi:hypothetical protein